VRFPLRRGGGKGEGGACAPQASIYTPGETPGATLAGQPGHATAINIRSCSRAARKPYLPISLRFSRQRATHSIGG